MTNLANNTWPYYAPDEISVVERVLKSGKVNYWTGEEGHLFEQEFADFCGVKHAIAVANGSVALELALTALGIGKGDEVIVTSRSFIASASAIVMVGAQPVFADVDEDSQNVTRQSIAAVLSDKTKAVIAVHLAGWPCDMDSIMALAEERGLFVVEDCAQAHGALYKGRSVGSIGHVAAWSFCQDKIMTTGGEGGMLTTNRTEYWKRAWSFKDHGKAWDTVHRKQHPKGFRWLHESFGTNWRMTEMQSAIGRCQIRKLPAWQNDRDRNAMAIYEEFRKYPDSIRLPSLPEEIRHAWYKCYVFVNRIGLRTSWSRDRIMTQLNELGIPCFSGSCSEIYREKAFEGTGFPPPKRLPVAQELGETSLMFLVHPTLSAHDISIVRNAIGMTMDKAAL